MAPRRGPWLESGATGLVTRSFSDGGRICYAKVAAGGLVTGLVTVVWQPWIDQLRALPGDLRVGLAAIPFAILMALIVRRHARRSWRPALMAAAVTVVAFVCSVRTTMWIDHEMNGDDTAARMILAGLGGGFVGAAVLALGFAAMRDSRRGVAAWLPMLGIGTLAGALLACDDAIDLVFGLTLYPVWQAGVAVGLVMALRQPQA